jgi:hypothetical protein
VDFVSVVQLPIMRKLTFPPGGQDLGTVEPNFKVREVFVLVVQLAEVVPGFEE